MEVAIQRWKSVLAVDWRRAREESPWAELGWHGKLLYVLRLAWRLRRTLGEPGSWLDRMRTATWWRPWKLRPDEVAQRMTGGLSWPPQPWAAGWQIRRERPRRRQLQRLPHDIRLVFRVPYINPQPLPQQDIAA